MPYMHGSSSYSPRIFFCFFLQLPESFQSHSISGKELALSPKSSFLPSKSFFFPKRDIEATCRQGLRRRLLHYARVSRLALDAPLRREGGSEDRYGDLPISLGEQSRFRWDGLPSTPLPREPAARQRKTDHLQSHSGWEAVIALCS